ncbi:hypothetical protein BST46_25935 [Mycobacterium timonense]|uniref:Uncharacterized protein n=3 Tax=Mycobacterium avium complex (MAC) TaxID=120793 RepID=A0ABX3TEK0_9MYCO|nr:hypothetical protein BST19_20185 [Mycobacterium bouchedurhonense]ORB77187.1 hypothetical protein BST46_25935 [Mycobacterium timonense]
MASSRTMAQRGRRRARAAAPSIKPRRVENRVLDSLIGLRVSSEHQKAMDWKAKQLGLKTAQDWIREYMKDAIEQAVQEKQAAESQLPLLTA